MISSIKKKKCKEPDCKNYPEISMKGYCSFHVDKEVKAKIVTKRQQQVRKRRNLVNLKRKVYLVQKEVPAPKSPKKRQKRVPKFSKKMANELRKYVPLKRKFLKEHLICECGRNGCQRQAVDIHHKKGRIGKLLNDVRYWIAVSRVCHKWIEEHPKDAIELGLSVSRLIKV